MPIYPVTAPAGVRRALLAKKEIALLDVRLESQFAQGARCSRRRSRSAGSRPWPPNDSPGL